MNFGLFTKCGARGGSEHRSAEICNAFTADYKVYLFCEDKLNSDIRKELKSQVIVREGTTKNPEYYHELEKMDILLIVNSDSYSFSKHDYWIGKTTKKDGKPHHTSNIDLSKIRKLAFLYNFVISPSKNLSTIHQVNKNVMLISTNKFFIDEIKKKDGKKNRDAKFKKIHECNIPLHTINSPINTKFDVDRTKSDIIRIGRHSLPYDSKFHPNHPAVVKEILNKYRGKVKFDFMGVPSEYYKDMEDKDVTIREKYSLPVTEYLKDIDIFLYYTKWSRKEPWPRVTAEAMMAGCCCVTNGIYGMKEQIENGKDGFLVHDDADVHMVLDYLIEHPEIVEKVGKKAKEKAKAEFSSEAIYEKMKNVLMVGK